MEEIYLAIITVSLVVIILVLGIVLAIVNYKRKQENYYREKKTMHIEFERQLLQSQVEVQEATYSVLARELHDNIGQLLSSSKMLIGIAQRKMEHPPETLAIAEETVAKAIKELRSLSKSLDKEWLEQFDLLENLQAEISRLNHNGSLKIEFHFDSKPGISSDKQIILFRIIQEALQNIIKHAEAKNIKIEMSNVEDMLLIKITDDGKGFGTDADEGMGINNMKIRTRLIGGNISWSKAGAGTCVEIVLPLKVNELIKVAK